MPDHPTCCISKQLAAPLGSFSSRPCGACGLCVQVHGADVNKIGVRPVCTWWASYCWIAGASMALGCTHPPPLSQCSSLTASPPPPKSQIDNTSALIAASQNGHVGVVRALLARGADVNESGVWPQLQSAISFCCFRSPPHACIRYGTLRLGRHPFLASVRFVEGLDLFRLRICALFLVTPPRVPWAVRRRHSTDCVLRQRTP